PGRNGMHLHERDERRGDEQLVGNGIEQRSDRRDLSPAPGEETVQQIGGRGSEKNRQRQPLVRDDEPTQGDGHTLPNQRRHQQRNEEDARDRQGLGNVHLRWKYTRYHATTDVGCWRRIRNMARRSPMRSRRKFGLYFFLVVAFSCASAQTPNAPDTSRGWLVLHGGRLVERTVAERFAA